MNLLIKLLIFSFPFVFAVALFWPAIEQKIQPPSQIIEDDLLLKPSAISGKASSGIYRWVDENGRVNFSDQPTDEDAVPYTPKPLGYIGVSDDIKQRVAVEEYHSARIVASVIADPDRKATRQIATSAIVPNYKFSNTSAGQKHGYVLISGRVSGGSSCRQLRVSVHASSDMGGYARGYDDVKLSGSGSRLFEVKRKSSWKGGGNRRPQWEITGVEADCLSQ
ncbi:MAG: DUF4124 domain-containing protein [Desulfuromusa sp.]|nr:DUF4124 domain-containing protein [Desulfuromusa sp.]